jgi:hypothetical protein
MIRPAAKIFADASAGFVERSKSARHQRWRADTIQLIQLFSILLIQLFSQVNVVSHPVIPAQDGRP